MQQAVKTQNMTSSEINGRTHNETYTASKWVNIHEQIRSLLGRRELDGRLTSAQATMMLQEETIKRADRDRCQLVERIDDMERSVAAADNEKQLLQVQ